MNPKIGRRVRRAAVVETIPGAVAANNQARPFSGITSTVLMTSTLSMADFPAGMDAQPRKERETPRHAAASGTRADKLEQGIGQRSSNRGTSRERSERAGGPCRIHPRNELACHPGFTP
jgi:hypothetical protein